MKVSIFDPFPGYYFFIPAIQVPKQQHSIKPTFLFFLFSFSFFTGSWRTWRNLTHHCALWHHKGFIPHNGKRQTSHGLHGWDNKAKVIFAGNETFKHGWIINNFFKLLQPCLCFAAVWRRLAVRNNPEIKFRVFPQNVKNFKLLNIHCKNPFKGVYWDWTRLNEPSLRHRMAQPLVLAEVNKTCRRRDGGDFRN